MHIEWTNAWIWNISSLPHGADNFCMRLVQHIPKTHPILGLIQKELIFQNGTRWGMFAFWSFAMSHVLSLQLVSDPPVMTVFSFLVSIQFLNTFSQFLLENCEYILALFLLSHHRNGELPLFFSPLSKTSYVEFLGIKTFDAREIHTHGCRDVFGEEKDVKRKKPSQTSAQ